MAISMIAVLVGCFPLIASAEVDCAWYANIYRLVAQARDEGQSRSAVFLALAKNQELESMRDTYLDIVYQVYAPETVSVKITPEQFYAMAFKKCSDTSKAAKANK